MESTFDVSSRYFPTAGTILLRVKTYSNIICPSFNPFSNTTVVAGTITCDDGFGLPAAEKLASFTLWCGADGSFSCEAVTDQTISCPTCKGEQGMILVRTREIFVKLMSDCLFIQKLYTTLRKKMQKTQKNYSFPKSGYLFLIWKIVVLALVRKIWYIWYIKKEMTYDMSIVIFISIITYIPIVICISIVTCNLIVTCVIHIIFQLYVLLHNRFRTEKLHRSILMVLPIQNQ